MTVPIPSGTRGNRVSLWHGSRHSRRPADCLATNLFVMALSVRFLVVPVLLVLGISTAACSGDDTSPSPETKPTPLSKFDADGMTVARTDFCDRIPDSAVRSAVGELDESEQYGNGETAQIADTVKDVAHEFNCTFIGTSGAVARVWVFVPQVTRAQARTLVRQAGNGKGCHRVKGEGFGKPSTGALCRTKSGAEASYRGLFVDSWLACSVSDTDRAAKAPALLDRAGKWCVQAATAAATE